MSRCAHSTPMLSLDNAYNEQELRDWARRVHELAGQKTVEFVCELKLDGLSHGLALSRHGELRQRGNHARRRHHRRRRHAQLRTVRSVPLSVTHEEGEAALPDEFEVRGEVIMPRKRLRAHERRARAGTDARFRQPAQCGGGRRARAGAEHHGAAQARFLCLLPDAGWADAVSTSIRNRWRRSTAAGFKVNPMRKPVHGIDEVWQFINEFESQRERLRLRNRRRSGEGELALGLQAAGIHRQGSALGHRLQVRRALGHHTDRRHRRAGRPHRQAHARGVAASRCPLEARPSLAPRCTTWISSTSSASGSATG